MFRECVFLTIKITIYEKECNFIKHVSKRLMICREPTDIVSLERRQSTNGLYVKLVLVFVIGQLTLRWTLHVWSNDIELGAALVFNI